MTLPLCAHLSYMPPDANKQRHGLLQKDTTQQTQCCDIINQLKQAQLLCTYQSFCFDERSLHVWIDVLQVPLEALALEPLSELNLLGEIPDIDHRLVQQVVVAVAVEQLFVFVQPHLGYPGQITLHRFLPVLRKLVWVLASENMSHPGAGNYLNFSPTHPDLCEMVSARFRLQVFYLERISASCASCSLSYGTVQNTEYQNTLKEISMFSPPHTSKPGS